MVTGDPSGKADEDQTEAGEQTMNDPADYPMTHDTWIDGQHFMVRARKEDPSVYDFDWVNHPVGYGFMSACHPSTARLTRAEMDHFIREFLADIDPETGFLNDNDSDSFPG
jgi:hypothetical protein